MALSTLVFNLLFSLSAGTFFTFGFVKSSEVGKRYFLIHGLIFSSVALLAYLSLRQTQSLTVQNFTLLFLGCAFGYSLLARNSPLLAQGFYWLACLAAAKCLMINAPGRINTSLSALTLGFSMAAMCLGHWYLNVPKLSINELKRLSLILMAVLSLRLIYGLYQLSPIVYHQVEPEKFLFATTTGLFLVMRFLWGIVLPGILSVMVWKTVQIRSTQSATGILYVVVLATLTGEILSQYLALHDGIFL